MDETGSWAWAREAFDAHFAPLRAAGFTLERLPRDEAYWALHERELADHFPPEVFFHLAALRSAHEREGQARIVASRGGQRLEDFTVVRAGAQVVAMFAGHEVADSRYRMWHTNVHRDHRRRGLYGMILRSTIAYTHALGFDTITSEHAPSNNPVIIAKLRAGFRIFALDLDPVAGVSVHLRYFHNPEHLAAYEFRCGHASLSPRLIAHGMGAIDQLRGQLGRPRDGG